jgi:hypothetical protein
MLGPSAGALRCFRCGEERRCATDLVFIMVSEDLITAEERGCRMRCAAFLNCATSRTGCLLLTKDLLPDLERYLSG